MTCLADVSVTSVTAHQRYPWNGLVDIVVTLEGSAEDIAEAECFFVATNTATRAPVLISSIAQNGADTGSGTTWTRRFIWNAANDVGAVKIDDLALTVDAKITDCVQLWENGPYWAKCNVGATKPEEYGYYFWWGDTVGYTRNLSNNGWVSVKNRTGFSFVSDNCSTYGKDNAALQSAGYIDSTGNLVAAHDSATAHLGAPWRMPTTSEIVALGDNCYTTWTTRNGVSGHLVTGRGAYASKSIFLPAAGGGCDTSLAGNGSFGYYLSSTPDWLPPYYAWCLSFHSSYFHRGTYERYWGQSVRPLRGFSK